MHAAEVTEDPDGGFRWHGQPVRREFGKMGKSLNNVVTPDEMYATYGADMFRLYEMSMGPLDVSRPWQPRDVIGAQRFLQRLWRLVVDEETGEPVVDDEPRTPRPSGCCTPPSTGCAATTSSSATTPRSPS